jgi:hypothetical protein
MTTTALAPIFEKETVHVAFELFKATWLQARIDLPFSLNVTLPVRLPTRGPSVPTVAVRVAGLPTARGLPEEVNLVVVAALTVSSSRPDVLGA